MSVSTLEHMREVAELQAEIDRLQNALGHAKTTALRAQGDAKRYANALQERANECHWLRAVAAQVDGERATNARLTDEVERLREALSEIANQDPIEMALAPEWAQRIAKAALKPVAQTSSQL